MMRYVLKTVYNNVLVIIILLGKADINTITDLVTFKYKIRDYARLAFFSIFGVMFSVKAQTVPICLIDLQTSL